MTRLLLLAASALLAVLGLTHADTPAGKPANVILIFTDDKYFILAPDSNIPVESRKLWRPVPFCGLQAKSDNHGELPTLCYMK